jgi:Zn-finger protein
LSEKPLYDVINNPNQYIEHFHGKFLWYNENGDQVWQCDCGQILHIIVNKQETKKKVIDVSDYVTKGLKEPKQEEKT